MQLPLLTLRTQAKRLWELADVNFLNFDGLVFTVDNLKDAPARSFFVSQRGSYLEMITVPCVLLFSLSPSV